MDINAINEGLKKVGYIPDESLSTSLWLSAALGRPLLLEGDAGVGKTSIAAALAKMHGCQLIRLQCYEGLDLQQAAYEWNYSRQLLEIRLHEVVTENGRQDFDLFDRAFLLQRPLLQAISTDKSSVLLIDEIDRADEAFEAYLLEVLSDYQISIPELGTVRATSIPQVILTSNGTRDLSDALRRRCLYHFVDYPSLGREIEIVKNALPDANTQLVESAVSFIHKLRKEDLQKIPGVAETLDWIRALHQLKLSELPDDPELILMTLSCLLKTKSDHWQMSGESVTKLLGGERAGVTMGVAAGLSLA
ncbi:holliday junction ATP-dependent DNA helicase RuvB [mine drainage metagenome]|uniref:Holliday junction ATP-dependent DNA helicase RuvB n=1 Tax=mine drainage metagenome TaxID=410659 RepID=A0A1J5S2Q7_9ZZZZ